MATVIWVREVVGRDGVFDATPSQGYKRTFMVLFDVCTAHAHEARDADDGAMKVPSIGDLYPTDTGSVVQRVIPRHLEVQPRLWEVVVEYSSQTVQEQDPNPLLRPPEFDWDFRQEQVPCTELQPGDGEWQELTSYEKGDVVWEKDPITGEYSYWRCITAHASATTRSADSSKWVRQKGFVNSSDEPFDPPPSRDDGPLSLTITRFEKPYDHRAVGLIMHTLNALEFQGYEPGLVKLSGSGATRIYEGGIAYDRCRYFFEFRDSTDFDRRGWSVALVDQGYRTIDNSNGETAKIKDDGTYQPISKPRHLDGAGAKLAAGAEPVYLILPRYPLADWSGMNFPEFDAE